MIIESFQIPSDDDSEKTNKPSTANLPAPESIRVYGYSRINPAAAKNLYPWKNDHWEAIDQVNVGMNDEREYCARPTFSYIQRNAENAVSQLALTRRNFKSNPTLPSSTTGNQLKGKDHE